jgi:hypothetical protein
VRESEGIISATSAAAFSSTSGLTSSLASGSGGGLVGYGNQAIDPSTGLVSVSADSLLATSTVTQTVPTRSDTARIGLGYKATEKLTLGGEVESAVSGDPLQRYALGGDYLVAERTRLYLRAETQAGSVTPAGLATPTSSSNAVVFGASTSYWKDTQLFSEYRMRDAISSEGTQLASGVRNVWDLQPGLRASAAYEWTQVLTGVSPTTQAISGGLDFTGDPLWRGSTRLEYRVSGDVPGATTSQAFNTVLWEVMAARKISKTAFKWEQPIAIPIPIASMPWRNTNTKPSAMTAMPRLAACTATPTLCRCWPTTIRAAPGGLPGVLPPNGKKTSLRAVCKTASMRSWSRAG